LHSVKVLVAGRGDSTRPHSRTSHGSLLEPAVTSLAAEPAPGSLDDIDEDVDQPSPSSSAAAALTAAARDFSAASRSGNTTAGSKQTIHRMSTPLIRNRAQGVARKDGTVEHVPN
jgi:hypothetical protein